MRKSKNIAGSCSIIIAAILLLTLSGCGRNPGIGSTEKEFADAYGPSDSNGIFSKPIMFLAREDKTAEVHLTAKFKNARCISMDYYCSYPGEIVDGKSFNPHGKFGLGDARKFLHQNEANGKWHGALSSGRFIRDGHSYDEMSYILPAKDDWAINREVWRRDDGAIAYADWFASKLTIVSSDYETLTGTNSVIPEHVLRVAKNAKWQDVPLY